MTNLHPVFEEMFKALHPVDVKTSSNYTATTYRIRGQLRDVFKEIGQIFREYPPEGYSTYVQKIWLIGPDYEALMWRSNSCD